MITRAPVLCQGGYAPSGNGPGTFVATTADGKRTLGLVPAATWRAATAARGFPSMGFQFTEVHHMFPSILLTDALRRSGF